MKQAQLSAEQIATLYAKHLRGDTEVSNYLVSHGIELQQESVNEEKTESELSNSSGHPFEEHSTEEIPYYLPEQAFDFSVFTLTEREKTSSETDDDKLHGRAYISGDDKPTTDSGTSNKPLVEPLTETLRRLSQALRTPQLGHKIAIRPLIKTIANREVVKALPVQPDKSEVANLIIYVDFSRANAGVALDAYRVALELEKYLIHTQIQVVLLPEGPQGRWRLVGKNGQSERAKQKHWQEQPVLIPIETDARCLILSNINTSTKYRWKALLQRLAKYQYQPIWLSNCTPYGDTTSLGEVIPWGKQPGKANLPELLHQLTAIMLSVRIVSGELLRSFIQKYKLPACLETEFWHQSFVHYEPGTDSGAVFLEAETKTLYIKQLAELNTEQLRSYAEFIESLLKSQSNTQLHEHRLHLALLTDNRVHTEAELQESINYLQSLGVNMQQEGSNTRSNALFLQETIQQFEGYIDKADSKIQQTLAVANAYCYQNGITSEVNPALAERVQRYLGKEQTSGQPINIYQKGDKLVAYFEDEIAQSNELQAKVEDLPLMASAEHTKDSLLLIEQNGKQQGIRDKQPIALSEVTDFVLQSQFEALSITKRTAKDFYWAKKLSVTSEGIIVETDFMRMSWRSNNDFDFHDYFFKKPDEEMSVVLFDDAPKWLSEHRPQLDQYGLYVELSYNNIPFRLRHIPSGHFLMGSPEDEPERQERETQHPVELTQGFWLGETTVTQALWEAVMGNNPSNFKAEGDEPLPVEKVSWDDCIEFCQKLSKAIPDIKLELPTEAEWEYACRAGTLTPFNTGEQLTTEQANYHGEYPYEGREKLNEKQEYREKTVDVNLFEPNAWGLKQMHGNVWEWCADGLRDFIAESVVNPVGPMEEDGDYVVRGGSWFDSAQSCRSAYRFRGRRGARNYFLGLRLCVRSTPYSQESFSRKEAGTASLKSRSSISQRGRSGAGLAGKSMTDENAGFTDMLKGIFKKQ